jgi:pyruvate dehydrogenase (quinone)
MMLGDLLTAVQEQILIKVVIFNNGTLGFVELEMRVEGLLDAHTDLKNPDFSTLAEVIGFHGWKVDCSEGLENALVAFLAHPGSALLDVKVKRSELVFPPHVEAKMVLGTILYGAEAVLSGRLGDVTDLLGSNFVR